MPWTPRQKRYFHAVASGGARSGDLSQSKAKELLAHDQAEAISKPRRKKNG